MKVPGMGAIVSAERIPDDRWVSRALVLGAWFGMGSGLVELALLGVKKYGQHRIIRVSRDAIWMAPLADVLLCVTAALLLIVLAWRWQRLRSLRAAVAVTAFPAILTIFLHYRPLHIAAKALLALGIAMQLGVLFSRRPRVLESLMRWTTGSIRRHRISGDDVPATVPDVDRRRFVAAAATAMGGLIVGTRGWYWIAEARARRALPAAAAGSTNVLLIVLDTVRAQSLGLYGYERRTTPNLEKWAARGVTFDRAFATAPWTLPSHASMFTGRWHHEMSADWDDPLDAEDPTVAEVLARAGYATAGIVANTSYTTYEFGLDRGFTRWEDYPRSADQIVSSSALGATIVCGNRNEIGCRLRGPLHWYELVGRKPANVVRERFFAFLDTIEAERPFFAFLNFFDAHVPYLPPAPYDTMFAPAAERGNPMHLDLPGWEWTPDAVRAEQDAYDGAIAYLDAEIDRLLNDLEQRGRLDDTIVIITSDHGEEFMEHGVLTHGNSLYSPSLHVPLLVLWRDRLPGGARVGAPVSIRDIAATVADLTGAPGGAAFPGHSLARYWNAAAEQPDEPLWADLSGRTFRPESYPVSRGDMQSVVSGQHHYIRRGDGHVELYDVRDDPWERKDLSGTEPSVKDALAALVERIRGTQH